MLAESLPDPGLQSALTTTRCSHAVPASEPAVRGHSQERWDILLTVCCGCCTNKNQYIKRTRATQLAQMTLCVYSKQTSV